MRRIKTFCYPKLCTPSECPPQKQTGKTANLMMLGKEVRLPEHLMYGSAASDTTSMEEVHDKLRAQQLQLRTGNRQEERSFKAGQLVWLKTKRFSKSQSHKLQSKYMRPYKVKEAARNHTYVIEQNGRQSRKAESRLKTKPGRKPRW